MQELINVLSENGNIMKRDNIISNIEEKDIEQLQQNIKECF